MTRSNLRVKPAELQDDEAPGAMPAASLRKSARQERKRTAVLRAAVASFNKKGFHQTSLEEIGEKIGLTKAALYYYFPNKSALLAACFERAMELTAACLERAGREGGDGRTRLIAFFRLYIEAANQELDEYFLLTEDYALTDEDKAKLVEGRDHVETALRRLVTDGIRDGSIVACDPKLAVFLLLGAVNWIPKWFSPEGRWTSHQLASATAAMLDRMISTRPAAALAADVGAIEVGAAPVEPEIQAVPLRPRRRRRSA